MHTQHRHSATEDNYTTIDGIYIMHTCAYLYTENECQTQPSTCHGKNGHITVEILRALTIKLTRARARAMARAKGLGLGLGL